MRLVARLMFPSEEGCGMARLVALVALPIAAHAQSIVAIPGGCVRWFDGTFCFGFKNSAFACCDVS